MELLLVVAGEEILVVEAIASTMLLLLCNVEGEGDDEEDKTKGFG